MVGCDVRRLFGLNTRGGSDAKPLACARAIPASPARLDAFSISTEPCLVGAGAEERGAPDGR